MMDLRLQDNFGFLPSGQLCARDIRQAFGSAPSFKVEIKGGLTKAKWCGQLLRARRDRERFLGSKLFADPAWDMLLELFVAELSQRRVSVGNLAKASGTPMTTTLRWIDALVKEGLAERRQDPLDGRRIFVSLTQKGVRSMDDYINSLPPTVNPLNG